MSNTKGLLHKRSLMCLATAMLLNHQASAQLHTVNTPPESMLVLATEQFEQGAYKNAAQSAAKYMSAMHYTLHAINTDAADKAGYVLVTSKLKIDEQRSDVMAVDYLNKTANPAYKQRAAFALAQYYFRHNQLVSAIYYYELAGIANLTNKEIADAKFELAYCYFNSKQFDKAASLFQAIKELEGKYFLAGNYYYGLLAYNQGNYEDALKSFDRIANDKGYKAIVPYYMAEIYYFTGNKDKALKEAKRLMALPEKLYYDNELHLLAAQVLFEEKRYKEALPYFEHYYNLVDQIRKEDLYELAYCYYHQQEWDKAIDKFSQLSDTRDSLAQTAMYLLGDCHLKTGDNKSARNAFTICADMPFNQSQREAALLLAAKLSYAMGYNSEALTHINDLLESYPNSEYKDEAKTMKSDLLIKTNQYVAAYNSLIDVKDKDAAYWQVRQKVMYGFAMMQMQKGDMQFADSLLSMSLQRSSDEKYEQAANFWKSELAYKTRRFEDAIAYGEKYVSRAAIRNKAEVLAQNVTLQNAYTTMGYAAMELQRFDVAQQYFSTAQMKATDAGSTMDAVLREADAVFMQKGYMKAIALYDKVIAAKGEDADYAKYQKGIVLGVIGKRADKATVMQSLMNAKPASKYANEARYELALVQIEEDKYQAAIGTLAPLTNVTDKGNFAVKSLMKTAFCYQQMNADDKAIETLKKVVADYPAAEERTAALDALRGLYIDNNQPQAFAQLLKENNIRLTDDKSMDSTYYGAAETQYAAGNWAKAKQSFGTYLQQYPDGVFATKAAFYKAEASYQLNDMKEALTGYDAVLQKGWSDFAERSALKAATISAVNNDHAAAMRYYGLLRNYAMGKENLQESYTGMMRSAYHEKQYGSAALYADTLLTMPGIAEGLQTEGSYIKAKSLYETGKQDEAYPLFAKLTNNKKSIVAAEASYYVAESLLKNGKLKEAEEQANKAVKLAGGNDVLTVKSYLLIAEVLVKQDDYFNAKALLQSIVKNAKVPALKEEATKKLEEAKATETKKGKLKQE